MQNASGPVTMRQIAQVAGVSVMTVSRALRLDPAVAAATRVKVEDVARQMGYRADPQMNRLMNRLRERRGRAKGEVIAGITSVPEGMRAPFFRKAIRSATERAEELGYGFEVFTVTEPDRFNPTLQRTLLNRGIEGLVLLQMREPARVDPLLDWSRFSVVAASVSVLSPAFPRVIANHHANAEELCAQLARRGCRRIGFVGTKTFSQRTRRVFESVTIHVGFELGAIVPPLLVEGATDLEPQFKTWTEVNRPDAVIVYAEETLQQLRAEAGSGIVFVCTNLSGAESSCSGVNERHDLVGQHAIELLVGQLQRFERGRISPASVLVDGSWVEGR